MISRFVLLVPSFTKKEAFKKFTNFFQYMQIFHQLISVLYTGNLGLCYCVYIVFADLVTYIALCFIILYVLSL